MKSLATGLSGYVPLNYIDIPVETATSPAHTTSGATTNTPGDTTSSGSHGDTRPHPHDGVGENEVCLCQSQPCHSSCNTSIVGMQAICSQTLVKMFVIYHCSRALAWDIELQVYVKIWEPRKMKIIFCKTVCAFSLTQNKAKTTTPKTVLVFFPQRKNA